MISQIQSPEHKELQKNISTIYEARELWDPEIQALDVKIQEVMKGITADIKHQSITSDELKKLMDQKNALIQEVHTSKEFQDYIQKNQSKLESLNVEMKKYWIPEMVSLEKEIAELNKEVYSTPEMK